MEAALTGAPTQTDLAALESEHQQALAELKRARADYENRRRQLTHQSAALSAWASERVAAELASLETRLGASQSPSDAQHFYDQLLAILAGFGVEAITASGQFDPSRHQAMVQTSGPEGQVVLELRRGYTNGGRVVRPALVAVGSGENV